MVNGLKFVIAVQLGILAAIFLVPIPTKVEVILGMVVALLFTSGLLEIVQKIRQRHFVFDARTGEELVYRNRWMSAATLIIVLLLIGMAGFGWLTCDTFFTQARIPDVACQSKLGNTVMVFGAAGIVGYLFLIRLYMLVMGIHPWLKRKDVNYWEPIAICIVFGTFLAIGEVLAGIGQGPITWLAGRISEGGWLLQ